MAQLNIIPIGCPWKLVSRYLGDSQPTYIGAVIQLPSPAGHPSTEDLVREIPGTHKHVGLLFP